MAAHGGSLKVTYYDGVIGCGLMCLLINFLWKENISEQFLVDFAY